MNHNSPITPQAQWIADNIHVKFHCRAGELFDSPDWQDLMAAYQFGQQVQEELESDKLSKLKAEIEGLKLALNCKQSFSLTFSNSWLAGALVLITLLLLSYHHFFLL